MQVYVDLLNLGNSKLEISEGRPEGGIFIFPWPLCRNPDFLGRRKTLACIFVIALLPSGWFLVYCMIFRLEAAFHNRERFHSPHDMWLKVGMKYRPHRVLTISAFNLCNMMPNRWIKRGNSMDRIERACCWDRYNGYVSSCLHDLMGIECKWWILGDKSDCQLCQKWIRYDYKLWFTGVVRSDVFVKR